MSKPDWLSSLEKTLEEGARQTESRPGDQQQSGAPDVGTGQFAEQLAGRTLRQYSSGSLGGSTEKILVLEVGGQFVYREISQYDGGRVPTDPEYGMWAASGNFPTGQLSLSWTGGGTTNHMIGYYGGDTCTLDGIETQIG